MDYDDDCGNRSQILNNAEDAFDDDSELDEQKSCSNWPANGIRKQQPLVEIDNFDLDNKETGGDASYGDNVYDFAATSYGERRLNDFLHSSHDYTQEASAAGHLYDNSNKYGRFNHLPLLSEVLRISKILRRLMVENNRKAAVDLCKKLDAAVRNQSNASYICRSFNILFDNMITVLKQCPPECLEHASEILGIMGYINRFEFSVYKNNMTKAYSSIKTIRKYLMISLRTTICCDAVNLDLKPHSENILSLLKEYLENAEIVENFMAISETICELSKHYQQSFQRHFTDIVDIIVGWHLEAEQPAYLKRHCAKILQRFADYFLSELEFTLGLLGQFIEDIDVCGEELIAEDAQIKTKQQTEARVGAFIGAFTSIMKALVSKGIGINHLTVSSNIMSDAKRVVNKVATKCFSAVASVSEETVVNLNEFYCVISSCDRSVENLSDLEKIIELQLNHLYVFNENQLASFLFMILNIVRQYRTQLPLNFVSLIMKKENPALRHLKLSVGSKSYNLLLRTYHEILIIKNVPLLQEAYRHILKDINETICHLKTAHAFSSAENCELILSFYLAAISALSCQTSSIIGMYALNPSILELLISNCQAANQDLWIKYPTLHNSLLGVIIEHSTKNHNFRQSSRLLYQHQDSPSSENFGIILNYLACQTKWHVSYQIIDWVRKLLEECHEYSSTLTNNDDFLQMCDNIIYFAPKEPTVCSKVLSLILKYPNMPENIVAGVKDIALYIIPNCDDDLLCLYCELLALLPLQICLSASNDDKFFYKAKEKARELQHWHQTTTYYTMLRPKYFKAFVNSLEPNCRDNYFFESFVDKSFIDQRKEQVSEYLQLVQHNVHIRQRHLQYEAARFCVMHKLRTPLGKPQETFLAIEAIIMKYARLLSDKAGSVENLSNAIGSQQNCQMLLGFLDDLEKHIYNAAEGTAFAMLPAEKPSKTFFRVNASTCGEWFKRIRTAVNLIGLHCMAPEIVIRNCENILLNETDLANQGFRDRTVTTMVWALFACGESDTMLGLQSWLKAKQYRGYEWIQHIAEHASGHFEKAAVGYLKILGTENSTSSLDAYTRDFIEKQLSDCLSHLCLWSEMVNPEQSTGQINFQWELLDTLCQKSCYNHSHTADRGSLQSALLKMTEWQDLAKSNIAPQAETFSSDEVLRTLRNICLVSSALCTEQNTLNEAINALQDGLRVALLHRYEPDSYNHQLDQYMLLNHVSYSLEQHTNLLSLSEVNNVSSVTLNDTLSWSIIMDQGCNQGQNLLLLLNAASRARTDGNLNYSQSLLERFFKWKALTVPLSQIATQIRLNELVVDYSDTEMIRGIEELVKYMYAQNNLVSDAIELSSACCSQILQQQQQQQEQTLQPISLFPSSALNLLLTLSDWLTSNRLQSYSGRQLQNLQNILPDIGFCVNTDQRMSNMLPPLEYAVGKLLNASILCDGASGEAWLSFGNWCYRWGKKLMEASGSIDQQPFDRKDFKLTNRSIASIREILSENLNDEQMERLLEFLNSHIVKAIDEDTMDSVYAHTQNTTEFLENELKKFSQLSSNHISAIVCIWRQAQKGVYSFYEEATSAYFKYLAIQSNALMTKKKTSSEVEDCTFVTTTLRLLRLIVKHANGLQEVLEEGLRNTPLRPWKVIVPQLFSRLNHHEPYVRQSVSDLLCRLAVNQQQLIIFPAVVGAQQELKNSDNPSSQIQLTNCFVSLLSSLSQQAPDVVLQVQLLVKELRRITLLWEEYWVQSLAQLYAEYSPLYNALEAESKKTTDKEAMSSKYEIFRNHLFNDFNKIAATTANEPETNYERSFQDRFKPHIESMLKDLQICTDYAKPAEYWQKIRQLYSIFQQRPLRGSSSTYRVSDISPVLANMRNTSIAMPGIDTYEQSSIYIKSVDSTVFILPTKTKPKKLSFLGSNGQSYTFLFKGLEDLHLDERIMQFLSISNAMMVRSYGSKAKTDCFKAHHYSVIPLGSQSGLISWVQNCTPLFAIYKKWQQRESTLKQQQKERQSSKSSEQATQTPATANTLRPSELFFNKLTPLLAERNIKITDPRRQWPLPVLKRVLRDLCAETPRDLLSKEIWCNSVNSVDWRRSVRCYTMSLAVMSVIGYVIGLGDRHLDNILIKLGTGEIVHIDYNVCFEKGKALRVPERVPFRLSQNIKDALGLVGTEGPFRMACSHVLKILRKERETLLTLLEAFVYDPLVDWTVSDDGGSTSSRGTSAHSAALLISSMGASKELQLSPKDAYKGRKPDIDLSRQALTSKITEIKPAWFKYKIDFDLQLANIEAHLTSLLDLRESMVRLEQERDNFTKQQALVQELEALGSARGSHALNTVSMRYESYKKDLDSFTKTKQLVYQTVKDLDLVSMTYFKILLQPEEVMRIDLTPLDNENDANAFNEFELVRDVLVRNNWHHIYTQAKFTKHEMDNCILQAQRSAIECRDLLMFYSRVMRYYPRHIMQQNLLLKYKKEYERLVESEGNQTEQTSDNSIDHLSPLNIAQCQRYFEKLTAVLADIQIRSDAHANRITEEHKYQEVAEQLTTESTVSLLRDFYNTNNQRNHQLVLISSMRQIQKANELFALEDREIIASQDCFLIERRLCFVQKIGSFVFHVSGVLNNLSYPKELRLLTNALQSLCNLRNSFESLCEKIVGVFVTDRDEKCQELFSDPDYFKKYPEYDVALNETDKLLDQAILSLQVLQERLSYLQEFHPNDFIDKIMNCWNTNIAQYLTRCRNELLVKIISDIKCMIQSYLESNPEPDAYDLRKITISIQNMFFDIEQRLFNGLFDYIVQLVTLRFSDLLTSMDHSFMSENDFEESDRLCENIFYAIQKDVSTQLLQVTVKYYSQLMDHHSMVATAYYWLNESILGQVTGETAIKSNFVTRKQEFLNKIHNINQNMGAWNSTMSKIQFELEDQRKSICEFLETMLSMDNSMDIAESVMKFGEMAAVADQRYVFCVKLTTQLTEYTAVLLQFEMSDDTAPFECLVKQFIEDREKLLNTEMSITEVERNLVQLLDPEGKIDQYWVENISDLLDEMIFATQKNLADLEKEATSMENLLRADGQNLQLILDSSIRTELRQLIKMVTKSGKQTLIKSETGELFHSVRDIQQTIKLQQIKLTELQIQLFLREYETRTLVDIRNKIEELCVVYQKNNKDIAALIEHYLNLDLDKKPQQRFESPSRHDNANSKEVSNVNSQVGGEQKRNAYAVSVWKRIRMKLEGRDPDPNRRSSVAEQIDYVITEATSEDNLASLYEGWTPWV